MILRDSNGRFVRIPRSTPEVKKKRKTKAEKELELAVVASLLATPILIVVGILNLFVPVSDDRKYYGGVLIRAVSFFIDVTISSILASPLSVLVEKNHVFLVICPMFIIYSLFMNIKKRETFGKKICGLTIVDSRSHKPLTVFRHVIRSVFYFLYVLNVPFIAFSPKRQGLHDYIGSAVVFKSKYLKALNNNLKEQKAA